MRTFTLKINMNNLKKDIEKDYFKYRDIFYRCLIVNLCIYSKLNPNLVLTTTIIEDSHYNQYLLNLINLNYSLEDMVKEIDPLYNVNVFIDTHVYLEEFITLKHNPNVMNIYSLTIDDTYNIVINNKQIRRSIC